MALEHPRTSAAAGIILAAAIVGGVLWYIFGTERQEPRRPRARVRAGTGRKRAKIVTGRGAARRPVKSGGERTPSQSSPPQGLHPAGVPGRHGRPGRRHPRRPRAGPRQAAKSGATLPRTRSVLDGDELELVSVSVERQGRRAHGNATRALTIPEVPDAFTLETVTPHRARRRTPSSKACTRPSTASSPSARRKASGASPGSSTAPT